MSPNNITQLFTIGYATKPIDIFIQHLREHNIDVVADVRSVPYSKAFADYHQENIIMHLRRHNIRYVYLGDELGPRSKDDRHYNEKGQVQFNRLMQSPLFNEGISRLQNGLNKQYNIALMCAEKDPATCHRSLLIGHYLQRSQTVQNDDTLEILHIGHNGNLETQECLESRVAAIHDKGLDLFMDEEERKTLAYHIQLELTSYIKPEFK